MVPPMLLVLPEKNRQRQDHHMVSASLGAIDVAHCYAEDGGLVWLHGRHASCVCAERHMRLD